MPVHIQQRTSQTLAIEAMLEEGTCSLSEIARIAGVSRQRVQHIHQRKLTTSPLQPPNPAQTRVFAQVVEGLQMSKREKIPAWVSKGDKAIMVRCIPATHMRRFKVAQMYWIQGMTMLDISIALDITVKAIESILHRLRMKP